MPELESGDLGTHAALASLTGSCMKCRTPPFGFLCDLKVSEEAATKLDSGFMFKFRMPS